jgi:putative membrane protein
LFTTAADPLRADFPRNRLLQGLAAAYGLWWLLLAVAPYNRFDWFLENLLVVLFVGLLAATYRRFPLSDLSYLLIAVFLALHAVGAHYTYSKTPLGDWISELLGWERNHYDRAVHFLFGLFCAYPLRETVMRGCSGDLAAGGWRAGLLAFAVVLALSSGYEMLEWVVAIILSPEEAMAFLGTQGDIFDAQKDTALATLGAALSLAALPLLERRRRAGQP